MGVAGSGESNLIANTVTAQITSSDVTNDDNITLQSLSTNSLNGFGGTLAGGAVGAGATVVVNQDTSDTTADISGSTVKAGGQGTADNVPEWTVSGGSDTQTTQSVDGVAVVAATSDPLTSDAATGAAGGTSLGANAIVDLIQTQTTADLSGSNVTAAVGSSSTANPSLVVRAHQHTDVTTGGATVALAGGNAFGAAIDVINLDSQTSAYIAGPGGSSKSVITTGGDVDIDADTWQNINTITATASLSSQWSLAGSASAVKTTSSTDAYISGNTTVTSGGALSVTANDTVEFPDDLGQLAGFAAGTLSGSEGYGLGGAIAVALIGDTTEAYISGASAAATGNVSVSATTTEDLPIYVGTAGIAGTAALAGAIAYVDTTTATTADIAGAAVTSNTGDVGVTATDTTAIKDQVGSAAFAGAGDAGAAIDVLTSRNSVTADINTASSVQAPDGGVTVSATADRDISSAVIALGASGALSLSGAISLVDLGIGLSQAAKGDLTSTGSQQSTSVSSGLDEATGPGSTTGIDTGPIDPNGNNASARWKYPRHERSGRGELGRVRRVDGRRHTNGGHRRVYRRRCHAGRR